MAAGFVKNKFLSLRRKEATEESQPITTEISRHCIPRNDGVFDFSQIRQPYITIKFKMLSEHQILEII